MAAQLPFYSSFVRKRFKKTRRFLLGKKSKSQALLSLPKFILSTLSTKKFTKNLINFVLSLIMAVSVFVAVVVFLPEIYYQVFPADTAPISTFASEQDRLSQETSELEEPEKVRYIPPQEESLPEGEWLVIPRIGVRTPLRKTEDAEEALSKGVWQVPGYAEPGDTSQPIILAAHRFGWDWWWQSEYWRYNSFYLLPDTEPGDRVEIIADKRKWVYEIYDGHEGQDIADYNADMILYTCKFLNSPVRHFRYAKLLDPTQDTQVQ